MRMSLKFLTYLSTATDKGSLKQAAAELCVVPSAIAAAINSVEEELQLKLITRFPARGIAATETGKIIMRRVDALVDNYNELIDEGVSIKNSLNGTLRIEFAISSAPAFMPALVRPIIKRTISGQACTHRDEQRTTNRRNQAFFVVNMMRFYFTDRISNQALATKHF